MTTRHIPKTGRHQQLTRLPDLTEAKAQRDAEERVHLLESELRRLQSNASRQPQEEQTT